MREECRKHSKEVTQRTSARGAVSTVATALCRRLGHALLAPEHVQQLLPLTEQARPLFAPVLLPTCVALTGVLRHAKQTRASNE